MGFPPADGGLPFGPHGRNLFYTFILEKGLVFLRLHRIKGNLSFPIVMGTKAVPFGKGRSPQAGVPFGKQFLPDFLSFRVGHVLRDSLLPDEYFEYQVFMTELVRLFGK